MKRLIYLFALLLLTLGCKKDDDTLAVLEISIGQNTTTDFPVAGTVGSYTFTITSNTNWTVSSDEIWCTVSPTSGKKNGTVTFKVDENKAITQRMAQIMVTYGSDWRAFYVVQAENAEFFENIVFADANFKAYCVDNFDTNHDGEISRVEAANVTAIDVSGTYDKNNNITSLQGIEFFTALDMLDCSYNQLTQLDLSKNTALRLLECVENQLTQLDVSKNTALTFLNCRNNQLTQLDVSNTLTELNCRGNKLTQLDVSNNTALTLLFCGNNQLSQLDLSKNTALTYFNCYNNQLAQLDVSNNMALIDLLCSENQLTQLDLSKNTALTSLYCDFNQLTQLDLSKNTALKGLYCGCNQLTQLDVSKNTALTHLSCDHNQLTQLDVSKNTALEYLVCENNELTQLDVSNNRALTELRCDYSPNLTKLYLKTGQNIRYLRKDSQTEIIYK